MKQKSPTFVGLFSCYTLPLVLNKGQHLAGSRNY